MPLLQICIHSHVLVSKGPIIQVNLFAQKLVEGLYLHCSRECPLECLGTKIMPMETIAWPWEHPQDLSWCQHWFAALEETQGSPEFQKEHDGLAASSLGSATYSWETALGDPIRDLPCFAQELHSNAFKARPWALVLTWAVLWPCLCLDRDLPDPSWPILSSTLDLRCHRRHLCWWSLLIGHRVTGPHQYRQGPAGLAITCGSQLAFPGWASPFCCPH